MPYITQEKRKILESTSATTVGELNYTITKICHEYIYKKGLSYTTINEVIGVLECAKLEAYRTIASSLEDKKRTENGPVSKLDA